jgi:hypothetical protein
MHSRFLFIRLADEVEAPHWNGNDEKAGRTWHNHIPKKDTSKDIALYWRTGEKAEPRYIGNYRLDLEELCKAGFIGTTASGNEFRLRFIHADNDCIYIQKDRRSKRLIVGVFE